MAIGLTITRNGDCVKARRDYPNGGYLEWDYPESLWRRAYLEARKPSKVTKAVLDWLDAERKQ